MRKIKSIWGMFSIIIVVVIGLCVIAVLASLDTSSKNSNSSVQEHRELLKAEKSFKGHSVVPGYLWVFARRIDVNNQDLKFIILKNSDTNSYRFHLKGSDGHTIAIAYLAKVQPKGDNEYIYAASVIGSNDNDNLTPNEKMESYTIQSQNDGLQLIFNNNNVLNMNSIDNQFNLKSSGSFIMHLN